MTRSVSYDHYRSKLARTRDAEDALEEHADRAPASGDEGPERALQRKDDAALLWGALKMLPAEFRVPLVLFEIEGLSYEAIAQVEGVPIGTIRSRLSRGRQQLEGLLARQEPRTPARTGTAAGAQSSNPGSARP